MVDLPASALAEIARSKRVLEHPSLAIRLADVVGRPVEFLIKRLPEGAQQLVATATGKGLDVALGVALRTLGGRPGGKRAAWLHRAAIVAAGAAGGAAGLAGLAVELPVSLAVILRAIADAASAEGEDLSRVEARLECLSVFSYGARAASDDDADSAYFITRTALTAAVSRATEYVAERGVAAAAADRGAPALLQLTARIAQRLGVTVTDKAAAQLFPLVGALGGATINALFIDHYQRTARAHFTLRRLERVHGAESVKAAYAAAPG
jgi:hypothetical protein